MSEPISITCKKCGKDSLPLINGRCMDCNPLRACRKCDKGTLVSRPTPNWMNRWTCDVCGKSVSR